MPLVGFVRVIVNVKPQPEDLDTGQILRRKDAKFGFIREIMSLWTWLYIKIKLLPLFLPL